MKELIELNRKLMKNKRISHQIKTYCCMCAAHYYELAYLHSSCAKKITLAEAQNTADLINIFISDPYKKNSAIDFMVDVNEKANESIEDYREYEKRANSFPFDKRIIAGFSKWYAKNCSETVMIRLNAAYIRWLGATLLEIFVGEADMSKLLNLMKDLANNKDLPFNFHPGEVRRSFVKAMWKVKEIEEKVSSRKKFTHIE